VLTSLPPNGPMPILVFDFDSTLVRSEGLDELFAHSVRDRPDGGARLEEFRSITDLGMEGGLPFQASLERRMAALEADRSMVEQVARVLAGDLTRSVARHAPFFHRNRGRIYVVSGGFHELIEPAVRALRITPDRIGANRFLFDEAGRVTGLDPDTPLARGGKGAALEEWDLDPARVWVVGDGATDLELRDLGLASRFVAFTENRRREPVIQRADHVAASMDDLLTLLDPD